MRKLIVCAFALGMLASVSVAKVSDEFIVDIVMLYKSLEPLVETQPTLVGNSLKEAVDKAKANPNDEEAYIKAAFGCYRMAGYITHYQGSNSKTSKLVELFGGTRSVEKIRQDCEAIIDKFRNDPNAFDYLRKAVEVY